MYKTTGRVKTESCEHRAFSLTGVAFRAREGAGRHTNRADYGFLGRGAFPGQGSLVYI